MQNFIRSVCAEAAARRAEIAAARAASVHTLYLGGGTPSLLSLDQLARLVSAITDACGGEEQFAMPEGRRGAPTEGIAAEAAQGEPSPCPPGGCRGEEQFAMPEGHRGFRAERSEAKEPLFEEFTMEVNPDDIVAGGVGYVRGLRALGVNRISMGVQSWDDGILRWMNRRHDAAGARRAYEILREGGIENSSLDLIFGLSQLSEAAWAETLRQTVALRPEHISAYQLSVDPDSALDALVRAGRYREATDAAAARQYAMLCETLAAAGYIHYEVSNFALPGREAVHNSAYWRRLPYVGLGPAAHSFDGLRRTWNAAAPDWNAPDSAPGRHNSARNVSSAPDSAPAGSVVDAEAGETPQRGKRHFAGGSETLTAAEAREEAIMLGLRTAAGIPAALLAVAPEAAASAPATSFALAPAAERLLAEGALVRLPGGRLRIPESRWFVSDDIISSLL